MSKNGERFNDREEIYGKEPHKKKKNKFRENGSGKVRDFKRNYSRDTDKEDLDLNRWRLD